MSYLQYNAESAQAPLQMWDTNRPYFVPRIQVDPAFQEVVPFASAMLANAFVAQATNNQARMYTFNRVSRQNWQNEDFALGVWTVIMVLMITIQSGRARMGDLSSITDIADTVSAWMTAEDACTVLYQANIIPPNMMPAFNNAYQEFGNAKNQINNMLQGARPQQQQYNQNQTFMGGTAGGWNGQTGGVGMFGNTGQNVSYQNVTGGGGGDKWSTLSTSVSSTSVHQNPQQQSSTGSFFNTKFQNEQKPEEDFDISMAHSFKGAHSLSKHYDDTPEQKTTPQVQQETVAPQTQEESEYSVADWKRNHLEPYLTYIQPGKGNRVIAKSKENGNLFIEKISGIGVNAVERGRHQIGKFGNRFMVNSEARHQAIAQTLDTISSLQERASGNKITDALIEIELNEFFRDEEPVVALTLKDAIFETGVLSYKYRGASRHNVFVANAYVCNPKVIGTNRTKYLNFLAENQSFAGIARQMESDISEASMHRNGRNEEAEPFVYFISILNRYMTQVVNHALAEILMVKTSIDDFMEDAKELPTYLMKKYGELYGRAYSRFQKMFIDQLLTPQAEQILGGIFEMGVIEEEQKEIITFFPYHTMLALVELFEEEIMPPSEVDNTWLIKEATSPWLFKLVQNMAERDGGESLCYYIITRDEAMFRIQPALLGEAPRRFTITRVKNQ